MTLPRHLDLERSLPVLCRWDTGRGDSGRVQLGMITVNHDRRARLCCSLCSQCLKCVCGKSQIDGKAPPPLMVFWVWLLVPAC